MGFLDSLFGNKTQKEVNTLKTDLESIRAQFVKNNLEVKNDVNQMISVLAELDQEVKNMKDYVYEDMGGGKSAGSLAKVIKIMETFSAKNEKALQDLRFRVANFEKLSTAFKTMGKISLRNHDQLKSMDSKMNALEKNMLEHIKSTPETVVSKNEYFEDMTNLKKRLEMLEDNLAFTAPMIEEKILVNPEKKKKKQ